MTLYYTLRRFWFVPQLVERRLSAEGPAVGAGLPADAVAVGRDRDRDVVEPEGRPGLALPHDALLRLCLGLVVRGVDPEDLRALLLPAHLLNLEVISGASLAALLVITILPVWARSWAWRTLSTSPDWDCPFIAWRMMYKWLLCLRGTCASGTGPSSPSFCARSTEWPARFLQADNIDVRRSLL